METRVITFQGGAVGSDGLPKHFHRYVVFASKAAWPGAVASVASVVSITSAPEPSTPHFVVQHGSEKDAIEKARAALRGLPGNKDLQETLS